MNLRPLLYFNGLLLCGLSFFMIWPMFADLYFGYDDWHAFFTSAVITAFFGGALLISNLGKSFNINARDGFLLINTCWITVVVFASLPFMLSTLYMSPTDSFFEAMSGLTTTGATVITDLDHAPAGVLLWRALLQWLGGIGIIIMAITILPFLRVGGMQIFSYTASDTEKTTSRTISLSLSIATLYAFLSLLCAVGYMLCGMELFDAIAHAMTTISTGGFSTYNSSFSHFSNTNVEIVAIIFMMFGALPFVLILRAAKGNLQPLALDRQVHWFLILILACTAVTVLFEYFQYNIPLGRAVRQSTFTVVSTLTGTGFFTHDHIIWSSMLHNAFFFLILLGGCAGSTTAGIKIFRLQILYAIIIVQVKKLIYPNGVFIAYYNGKALPKAVPTAVMSFLFIYAIAYSALALALAFVGLDFETALAGAASSLANAGISLNHLGGNDQTYAALPESAKWIMAIGMFLGRIELFSFLVLLSPHFWKR